MRSDSSSGISSGVENSAMVARGVTEVEDVDAVIAAIQGEDVDAKLKVHIIVLTVIETIIYLISVGTSLVNLSTSTSTSNFSCYLLHCCFYCVDFLVRL